MGDKNQVKPPGAEQKYGHLELGHVAISAQHVVEIKFLGKNVIRVIPGLYLGYCGISCKVLNTENVATPKQAILAP